MADKFSEYTDGLDSPHSNAAIVTPSDTVDLSDTTRALLLPTAGTVTVDMAGEGTQIALPLLAGYNPCRVTRVYSTGTDVSDIVAVW